LLRQGSKLVLLENSIEHCLDVDEESYQEDDNSSIEEIKLDETQRLQQEIQKRSKKQRQLRNHILIFKNPKELLDKERTAENTDSSPLLVQKYKESVEQARRISLETVLDEDIDEGKQSTVTEFKATGNTQNIEEENIVSDSNLA